MIKESSVDRIVEEIIDKKLETEVVDSYQVLLESSSKFYGLLNNLETMKTFSDEWDSINDGDSVVTKLVKALEKLSNGE